MLYEAAIRDFGSRNWLARHAELLVEDLLPWNIRVEPLQAARPTTRSSNARPSPDDHPVAVRPP